MGYLEIIWIAEPGGSFDAGKRGGDDAVILLAAQVSLRVRPPKVLFIGRGLLQCKNGFFYCYSAFSIKNNSKQLMI